MGARKWSHSGHSEHGCPLRKIGLGAQLSSYGSQEVVTFGAQQTRCPEKIGNRGPKNGSQVVVTLGAQWTRVPLRTIG